MKRKIITVVMIVVAFLLQSTVFSHLTFADVRPNIMIALVSAIGFMRGKREGMYAGFITGLILDVFWGGAIGFYALCYTIIGYMNGMVQKYFYDDAERVPIIMISASDVVYLLVIFFCRFVLRGEFILGYFLQHILVPELIYTIVIGIIIYPIVLRVNHMLEVEEQRSASRFV